MTGTVETDSDRKFTAILGNWLVVGIHRSLRGLNRYSAGILVSGESGIGVSGVLVIIRPKVILK